MWQAFVTGFATQAAKDIEERHKEIQEQIYAEIESTARSNEEVKKRAAKDLETRAGLARELSSMLSGANIDPEQKRQIAIEMVRNPEAAKYFIDSIKEGRAGVNDIGRFIELPKAEEGSQTKPVPQELSDVFKARPNTNETTPPDFSNVKGPFGMSMSGSAERARQFAMAKLRMTEEEAAGLEYTPPAPSEGVRFNFEALRKDKYPTTTALQNEIADRAVKAGMSVKDFELTEEGKTLAARRDGRLVQEAEAKGNTEEKDRTASAIRQNISARLRERFQVLELDGVLQWQPDQFGGGEYRILIPSHEGAKRYQRERLDEVRNYFMQTGLVDKDGKIIGGRNAADALDAYANVDYQNMTVKGWRASPLELKAASTSRPATPTATPTQGAATGTGKTVATKAGTISVSRLRELSKAEIAKPGMTPEAVNLIKKKFKDQTGEDL